MFICSFFILTNTATAINSGLDALETVCAHCVWSIYVAKQFELCKCLCTVIWMCTNANMIHRKSQRTVWLPKTFTSNQILVSVRPNSACHAILFSSFHLSPWSIWRLWQSACHVKLSGCEDAEKMKWKVW